MRKPSLREVAFVDGESRGTLDRGWNPKSVIRVLQEWSIPVHQQSFRDAVELASFARSLPGAIFWPLAYNFDGRPEGHEIFDALKVLRVPRAAALDGVELTSKLALKSRSESVGVQTPSWWTLDEFAKVTKDGRRYFVKSDLSCDSTGVLLAKAHEVQSRGKELIDLLGQRVFVEADAGPIEWTAACIALDGRVLKSAVIQMIPRGNYMDSSAKRHNSEVDMIAAPKQRLELLDEIISNVVVRFGLTGYFRIDFVGEFPNLQVIDVNVLPGLAGPEHEISYFPEAFRLIHGWSYEEVIAGILGAVRGVQGNVNLNSRLAEFLSAHGVEAV